jgi:hypothetical protein
MWYIVAWYNDPKDTKRYPDRDDRVWTISKDPDKCGWETDMGCPGYGLTFEDATILANAANEIAGELGVTE